MADQPEDEYTGLALVCGLAVLAGAVDACGLAKLKDLYVSFMSGNTTSLGLAIAQRNGPRAALIVEVLVTFVAGAAGGEVAAVRSGAMRLPVVVLLAAAVLAVPPAYPVATVIALTFAMGALNAAMQRAGAVAVSVTYVTGTLVKFGRGLGGWLCGRTHDAAWLAQATPWLGLLCGAALGGWSLGRFGVRTYQVLPLAALALAGAAYGAARSQNGRPSC